MYVIPFKCKQMQHMITRLYTLMIKNAIWSHPEEHVFTSEASQGFILGRRFLPLILPECGTKSTLLCDSVYC